MYGWRARIGLIYPALGVLDQEFSKFVPDGVSIHITRVMSGEMEEVERATRQLIQAKVSCIALACTVMSFEKGVGFNEELINKIKSVSGVPATTTSTAAVTALKELRINRIVVASPYSNERNKQLKKFLEDSSLRVVKVGGRYFSNELMDEQTPEIVYKLAREADSPKADGVFIPCTGLRTAEILSVLEDDLGKPVVSANQATMWMSMRMARVKAHVQGCGRLLETK